MTIDESQNSKRILKVKANSLNSPKLKTVDLTYIRVLH